MDKLLKDIIKTPRLSIYQKEIEDVLIDEQRKRKEFYETMKDEKVEFIYGDVLLHTPVKWSHSMCSQNLMTLMKVYVQKNNIGSVCHEKIMISLTRNDYEPDVCYFPKSKSETFDYNQIHFPAPDFIAEVLSPSTIRNDRVIKFEDYAAHGVKEYWIIDPDLKIIEQYILTNEVYELNLKSDNGLIKSVAIEGFEIPVKAVFDSETNLNVLKNILNK